KPALLTISGNLEIGTTANTNDIWRGLGLGFYSTISPAGGQNGYWNFTGVVLGTDGSLQLVQNGGTGAKNQPFETVAWSGASGAAFSTTTLYTLSYTINTQTGAISNVSLSGSNADFSPIDSDQNGLFSDSATAFAGFTDSSSSGGTRGFIGNFQVSVA